MKTADQVKNRVENRGLFHGYVWRGTDKENFA